MGPVQLPVRAVGVSPSLGSGIGHLGLFALWIGVFLTTFLGGFWIIKLQLSRVQFHTLLLSEDRSLYHVLAPTLL